MKRRSKDWGNERATTKTGIAPSDRYGILLSVIGNKSASEDMVMDHNLDLGDRPGASMPSSHVMVPVVLLQNEVTETHAFKSRVSF
jgi:hypothetical protein